MVLVGDAPGLTNRLRLRDGFGWLNGFRLSNALGLALRRLVLRAPNIEDVSNVPFPDSRQPVRETFFGFGNIESQRSVARTRNVLAKLVFVGRENLDALAPARNRDVPLPVVGCRFDGGIGEQNVIHGLALSGIGSDRVATNELAIILRQHPPILQRNSSIGVNLFDRDQFAIGQSATVLGFAVGLELQAVTVGQRQFLRLADGEDLNRATLSLERRMHFPKRVTFAGTGAAPEQRHEIARGEDMLDGLTLLRT